VEIYQLFPDLEPTVEDIGDSTSENISDIESDEFYNCSDTSPYTVNRIQHLPKRYQAAGVISHIPFSQRRAGYNHLQPFLNPRNYKLARFLTSSKVPKMRINEFFRDNVMPDARLSFRSRHTFYNQTRLIIDDPEWTTGLVQYPLHLQSEFRYRNIIECIQYLLRQRAFVKYMLWEPVRLFNEQKERIYSKMNTAIWWWDEQVLHPLIDLSLFFVLYVC